MIPVPDGAPPRVHLSKFRLRFSGEDAVYVKSLQLAWDWENYQSSIRTVKWSYFAAAILLGCLSPIQYLANETTTATRLLLVRLSAILVLLAIVIWASTRWFTRRSWQIGMAIAVLYSGIATVILNAYYRNASFYDSGNLLWVTYLSAFCFQFSRLRFLFANVVVALIIIVFDIILLAGEGWRNSFVNQNFFMLAGYFMFAASRFYMEKNLKQNFILLAERDSMQGHLSRKKDREIAEAQKAIEIKSRFISVVSHELRTPLNAVIGMTRVLKDIGGLRAEQQECVSIITEASRTLLALVSDILDYQKLDIEQVLLQPTQFNLRTMIKSAAHFVAEKAFSQGLELWWDVSNDVPQILFGDAGRIKQILMNLLSNAVKFTHEGTVSAEATATMCGDEVVVSVVVTDSGRGIKEKDMGLLFKPFSQVGGISSSYGGTGLGLSISRSLARRMGGDVTCRSEFGKGSVFVLTFPSPRTGPELDENGMAELGPAIAQAGSIVGSTLLLYQEPGTRDRIKNRLEYWGIEVTLLPLPIPEDVGELLSKTRFDFLIVDERLIDEMQSVAHLLPKRGEDQVACYILTRMQGHTQALGVPGIRSICVSCPLDWDYLALRLSDPLGYESSQEMNDNDEAAVFGGLLLSGEFKALVVDDIEVNRLVAGHILTSLGVVCEYAEDGLQAVDAVCNGNVSIVFMDAHMPVMDGYEATKKIRQWEDAAGVAHRCIVGLSAGVSDGERTRLKESGVDDFVGKPIQKDDVLNCLKLHVPRYSEAIAYQRSLIANRLLSGSGLSSSSFSPKKALLPAPIPSLRTVHMNDIKIQTAVSDVYLRMRKADAGRIQSPPVTPESPAPPPDVKAPGHRRLRSVGEVMGADSFANGPVYNASAPGLPALPPLPEQSNSAKARNHRDRRGRRRGSSSSTSHGVELVSCSLSSSSNSSTELSCFSKPHIAPGTNPSKDTLLEGSNGTVYHSAPHDSAGGAGVAANPKKLATASSLHRSALFNSALGTGLDASTGQASALNTSAANTSEAAESRSSGPSSALTASGLDSLPTSFTGSMGGGLGDSLRVSRGRPLFETARTLQPGTMLPQSTATETNHVGRVAPDVGGAGVGGPQGEEETPLQKMVREYEEKKRAGLAEPASSESGS